MLILCSENDKRWIMRTLSAFPMVVYINGVWIKKLNYSFVFYTGGSVISIKEFLSYSFMISVGIEGFDILANFFAIYRPASFAVQIVRDKKKAISFIMSQRENAVLDKEGK